MPQNDNEEKDCHPEEAETADVRISFGAVQSQLIADMANSLKTQDRTARAEILPLHFVQCQNDSFFIKEILGSCLRQAQE